MTNVQALALIVGALMPYLGGVLVQDGLNKVYNRILVVLACGVAGALSVLVTGGFTNFHVGNLIGVIAAVFIASQAAYVAYFKGTATEAIINEKTTLIK